MSDADGLRLEGVEASYDRQPVLRGIDLTLGPDEVGGLLGPNGSGKTTLLRVVAGLEPTTAGRISLAGRSLNEVPTHRRGIGFVFQEAALFPGRTVAENVAYGLELHRWSAQAVDDRTAELLGRLRLAGLADRRAETLSGGERQRTALARTLAPRPPLVLLDEPFAAVDPELRATLRREFRAALRAEGVAALHVTHDPEEALAVSDRLFLLRDGRIVQAGPPSEVVRAPTDLPAARFLGYESVSATGGSLAFLARDLAPEPIPGVDPLEGTVEEVREGIGERLLTVRRSDGSRIEWRAPSDGSVVRPGEAVRLFPRRSVRFAGPPEDPRSGPSNGSRGKGYEPPR